MDSQSKPSLCPAPLRIIIVGAGIAGLSTAISLGKHGHSIVVLESTKEFQSIGAGLGLTPPTKQWYESESVFSVNDSACGVMEGFEVRRWDTGDKVAETAFPPVKKMISVLHGDLQSALTSRAQELDDVKIRFGSRVVEINTDSPEVVLTSGERISGDLIIIADGVNSTLKWKVCPSELEKAQFTGDAAYRLILPRSLLEKDEELLPLVQTPWVKRWDGPRGHVVAYPVHNYETLNVVLIHPDEDAEESWTSTTEKHRVVAAFQEWNSVLRKLVDLAPAEVPNFRIFTHSPSPAWVKGNVILLGDACHAMPPYLSQGVAQAVEDATAITAVLSLINSKEQLSAALRAYETSRRGRVIEIQTATTQAQQLAYRKDGEAKAAADKTQESASESKQSETVVKMMRSTWTWDAGEAARAALADILKSE